MPSCGTCGMTIRDAGEYHPHSFCELYRAGYDPWAEIRLIAAQLGLGDLPEHPPLITETHVAA